MRVATVCSPAAPLCLATRIAAARQHARTCSPVEKYVTALAVWANRGAGRAAWASAGSAKAQAQSPVSRTRNALALPMGRIWPPPPCELFVMLALGTGS